MELILAECLGLDRLGLYMNLHRPLDQKSRDKSRAMLTRRREREPLAYILGHKEFYGLRFDVSRAVLIPRPETELIVDRVIQWSEAKTARTGSSTPLKLADLGTGSGTIAVSAAHEQLKKGIAAKWTATDVSSDALETARKNAERRGVADRIEFRLSLGSSMLAGLAEKFDCICSNPPYLAEADRANLAPEISRWEPATALFAGQEGLDRLRELIGGASDFLNSDGAMLLEIGFGQQPSVQKLVEANSHLRLVAFHPDLAGIPRVLEVEGI